MDKYEKLFIEIVEFHDEDIVTVSNEDVVTGKESIDS